MTTTIITKNSSTASAVPLAGSLVQGELAVNVTDKKLYTKDSSATVVKVVGSLGNQEANAVAITGGTVAGVAQTGGTINNTPIGATTASTVRGTTVTATTGFSGDLTGNVTGNTTGTHTGAVTGNVTGNLTGNVTAASGTSTFNHVTISGSLDMDAGTTATITGLATPVNNTDAATKIYVDTAISNLVDGAPANLDTLNEIAAALNDDANLAATLTASIATKVSKAGDSMTGALAMGNNKITGLGTPTAGTDAATKTYVDTADALKLNLSGGTMTGNIVMGANKVTSTATPTVDDDLTRKGYVDSILGSATSAATSASSAATSATNAANSATASANSATASAASASSAAASYDSFDDRYLGSKPSAPSVDNDGNELLTGALYWNSTNGELNVWSGSTWVPSTLTTGSQTISGVKTFSNNPVLNGGTANGVAYLNGSKVLTTGTGLQFDGSNLGLGVTPSAWASYRALQIGQTGCLAGAISLGLSLFGENTYNDSGNTWRYIQTGTASQFYQTGGSFVWRTAPSGTAGNAISFTQAMTLDASGNLLVGTTSGSSHALRKDNSGFYSTQIINTSATNPYALQLAYSGVTGGAGQAFLVCSDNANRLLIAGNGNVTNVNGSYGAISDAKLKENVTDATPKLEKLNQVRVVNFNIIGDTQKQIGVVAQELEQIFPGMVEESPDRDAEGNDLGTTTKSVKYSVFVPMLIKALQEQTEIITALTARVAALESN